MKNLMVVCGALALALGCGKKTETAPSSGSGSAPGSAAAGSAAAGSAAAGSAAAAASDFDTHFKAGEALEDQKKWAEALAEFEAALAAKPNDPRTLNEVGFNATFAGKLDRAKEAGLAAVAATKDDKPMHAQALFNLGLAVEKDQPYAAAQLYTASLGERPNKAVSARLSKLMKDKRATEQNKDALALLSQVNVTPAAAPAPAASTSASPEDQALMDALERSGVEWESGAGKSVLLVQNVECRQDPRPKQLTTTCTSPEISGPAATALVAALETRNVTPTDDKGVAVYKVASIRCRSFNEGDSGAPDACEITP